MYKIGDNIVYGMSGVMTVVDKRSEKLTGEEKTYYVLADYGKRGSSLTYVPVDNEALVANMRAILTYDEALYAISEAEKLADLEWIPDSRKRGDAYRNIMRSANRAEILAMIRTIHNVGLSRAAQGKKNYLTDEGVMQKAESILALELSLSLGISEPEARALIDKEVKAIL